MTATIASPSSPELSAGPTTLPAWLLLQASLRPKAIAIRVKELGRWREISWQEHAERVESVGRALATFGVGHGDRVLILSENRPEWIVADLAVQGLGATTVGLFPTSPVTEVGPLLQRSGARVAVVEDEEQLDKLLEVRAGSALERIVVIDTRGIRLLEDPASSFEALEALGSRDAVQLRSGDLDEWRIAVGRLAPGGVATVAFTPGTSGEPKGALLTNANLAAVAQVGVTEYGLQPDDRIVSCLPLCEIAERVLVVAQATSAGCTVHFGEGGDALENDIREVRPTVFLGAPRLWQRLRASVDLGLRNAGRLKRAAFRFGTGKGPRALRSLVATAAVRTRVGLPKVRLALAGGAPMPADLLAWWTALGVDVREVYGLTETTGVGTLVMPDTPTGSVGRALPGTEITVAPDGEVLVRGPSVFAGYLDDAEETAAAINGDGWCHTGDLGALDAAGNLTIVGRRKDIIVTSGGHSVAPAPIERRLATSPFVRAAVVVGDGRPHLGALLALEGEAVGDWAAEQRLAFTTHAALIALPEVRELVQGAIDEVNEGLPVEEQVRSFALLPEDLSEDDGALTATLKVRRATAGERFADLVESMYA